jgi:class 3 adenylate cyclase/tetratricopeptide (TPR) repeat protein
MDCPQCQTDNPDNRKFCYECGSKLLKICPECGFENLPRDKFCGECAHDLRLTSESTAKDLSFDEKIQKIQKYLPKGLTDKILSQRDKIEGERKQVTVMFCDMEGFTPLVEELGPEEAYSIMDEVYEILIHKVHDYEGTVNDMTGDGIMALFGAPIALEDAPQRAIRSAYSIHKEMAKFSDRIRREREYILPVKMRIGIHTGSVVVGTLGNDLRVEFKAVGDTVNLASRIEEMAQPGATYVSGETFKLTEGFFRYESLGEREIKGKQDPVTVYHVIGSSMQRTRFDVSAERGLTPFVGRERELELLLDGFERAKEGQGQSFSIMAEAGVGKSRLLYEFRKAVINEDVTFFEGKCLSYSRGITYHPVIDILRSIFEVRDEDGDAEIIHKTRSILKILDVDGTSILPYILDLLGVKDSGIDKIPLSPDARKDRTIEAVKLITLKGAEIRPLIIAIEDLHWIDKNSEDYLKDFLDSIPGVRILLIFTYRPEFVHTWGGKSYHSQLTLNRLSNRESLVMLTDILGIEEIESNLKELVLEKSEGIPFFIEEFIKSLMGIGLIEKKENALCLANGIEEVTIPSTIQDVIMTRVDTLPEGAKKALQTGSVIEREFSYELIKYVTGISQDDLLSLLSVLKDSELLYERGIFPASTYIFKHALTKEVVYNSILVKRRKRLHNEIGMAIEAMSGNSIAEYYAILADHFVTGENYEKGANYSYLAAKQARKRSAFNDAILYAKKNVYCIEELPQTDDMQNKRIDARTWLGHYFLQMNYWVEAEEAIEPIVNLAVNNDYKRRLPQIYTIIASSIYSRGIKHDLSEMFNYMEEAIKIAEEINDLASISLANIFYGLHKSAVCEFDKALSSLEKALEISVAANHLWGISQIKSIISNQIYFYQGNGNLAYETSKEAIKLAEESGDLHSKAMSYSHHGYSLFNKGLLKDSSEHFLKAITICEKIDLFSHNGIAQYGLGETYFEMGEYKKAENHFNQAFTIMENLKHDQSLKNLNRICAARAKSMNNDMNIDLETLYRYEKDNKFNIYAGSMAKYIGEILLNIDDQYMSEAEGWIKKAIEADERNGMLWHLGRDYASYAKLLKRKGNYDGVKANLKKAIETLRECGADGWVSKYEKELAELS